MTKWLCTDDDSSQYVMRIKPHVYRLTEVREARDNDDNPFFFIVSDVIDLETYNVDEVEEVIQPYYDNGLKELKDTIRDEEEREQIIAECLFETNLCGFMTIQYKSFAEAVRAQRELVLDFYDK